MKNETDYDMSFQYLDEAQDMLQNLSRKVEVLLESQIELAEDFQTIKVIRLVKPKKPDIISVIKQIIEIREQMQIEMNKFTVKQLALKLTKLKKSTEEQLTTYFSELEQYYIAKANTVYKGPYKHFEQTIARYSQLAINYYKHAQLEV